MLKKLAILQWSVRRWVAAGVLGKKTQLTQRPHAASGHLTRHVVVSARHTVVWYTIIRVTYEPKSDRLHITFLSQFLCRAPLLFSPNPHALPWLEGD